MMSYTVMGDTVNFASRLEGANKEYGGRILVSEATIAGAAGTIEAREIDRVVTLGQTRPQPVYEIMAREGELTATQTEFATASPRDWLPTGRGAGTRPRRVRGGAESRSRRRTVADLHQAPRTLRDTPPDDGWDGAWHLERK